MDDNDDGDISVDEFQIFIRHLLETLYKKLIEEREMKRIHEMIEDIDLEEYFQVDGWRNDELYTQLMNSQTQE